MALRRGVALVVGLLVVAVLISAAGMTFIWAFASREPAVARNSTLVLQLDTDLRESSADDFIACSRDRPPPVSATCSRRCARPRSIPASARS